MRRWVENVALVYYPTYLEARETPKAVENRSRREAKVGDGRSLAGSDESVDGRSGVI